MDEVDAAMDDVDRDHANRNAAHRSYMYKLTEDRRRLLIVEYMLSNGNRGTSWRKIAEHVHCRVGTKSSGLYLRWGGNNYYRLFKDVGDGSLTLTPFVVALHKRM